MSELEILEDIRNGKGLPPLKSKGILSIESDDTSVQVNEKEINMFSKEPIFIDDFPDKVFRVVVYPTSEKYFGFQTCKIYIYKEFKFTYEHENVHRFSDNDFAIYKIVFNDNYISAIKRALKEYIRYAKSEERERLKEKDISNKIDEWDGKIK